MKKLYFLLRHYLGLNFLGNRIPGIAKPFILCYHQVDTREFSSQLEDLIKNKYDILPLAAFSDRIRNKEKGRYCTITLDDCLVEDVDKAVAVCKKYNVPITFFLPVKYALNNAALPGTWIQKLLESRKEVQLNGSAIRITPGNLESVKRTVGKIYNPATQKNAELEENVKALFTQNKINVDELIKPAYKVIAMRDVIRIAQEPLFDFQSHTFNHESLILCNEMEMEFEFIESKRILEEALHQKIYAICYPYGSPDVVGNKILKTVSRYYACGVSLVQGVCGRDTNIYLMPRIGIYPGDGLKRFWGKIHHQFNVSLLK